MMGMYFGCDMCDTYSKEMPVYVVFKGWAITNSSAMAWSCVGIILLTMLYRLLSSLEADYSNWLLKKLEISNLMKWYFYHYIHNSLQQRLDHQ